MKAAKKKARAPVPYETILEAIGESLDAARQWDNPEYESEWFAHALRANCAAEALIELLETHNCGSVGGFDHFDGKRQRHSMNLDKRYDWLRKVR